MTSQHDEYVLIGVDPGETTGMFAYFAEGIHTAAQYSREEVACNLNGDLWRWTERYGGRNIHIAIERYIITPKTAKLSQQPDALEVTGAVKALAQVHGIMHVQQFMKSNLRFASDATLRSAGWARPDFRHANDAARQAFALLREVDYPAWSKIIADAKLESEDEGRMTQ